MQNRVENSTICKEKKKKKSSFFSKTFFEVKNCLLWVKQHPFERKQCGMGSQSLF
jgi:hypothetical protein